MDENQERDIIAEALKVLVESGRVVVTTNEDGEIVYRLVEIGGYTEVAKEEEEVPQSAEARSREV